MKRVAIVVVAAAMQFDAPVVGEAGSEVRGPGGRVLPMFAVGPDAVGIEVRRVPGGGIQPRVVAGDDGTVHLLCFRGEPAAGDLFYARSADDGRSWSEPLRVNSTPGSAVAAGTIRGGRIALGRGGRVHVAWNGSSRVADSRGAPMLYSRLDAEGKEFEPERDVKRRTRSLDGGGCVAADRAGNVFVVWHANDLRKPATGGTGGGEPEADGEGARAVWVTRSSDDGATFATETRANTKDTGACGCCGLEAFVDRDARLWVLYRAATRVLGRDLHLLASTDRGVNFRSRELDTWSVPKCVMSLAAFSDGPRGLLATWETEGQVFVGSVGSIDERPVARAAMPGAAKGRRHPAIAVNSRGETLVVWSEGTGWNRGGALAWQLFDRDGAAVADRTGRRDGLAVWSFPAAFASRDGSFVILH